MENIETVLVLCLKLQRADEGRVCFRNGITSETKPKILFGISFVLMYCVLEPFHISFLP